MINDLDSLLETFIANDTVLRIIPRKTVFSHKGDVAKAHNLY